MQNKQKSESVASERELTCPFSPFRMEIPKLDAVDVVSVPTISSSKYFELMVPVRTSIANPAVVHAVEGVRSGNSVSKTTRNLYVTLLSRSLLFVPCVPGLDRFFHL